MRRTISKALCVAALCTLAPSGVHAQPAPDAPPAAQPGDEARMRYTRGQRLASEGDYDAALVEFQRAYDLSPSYIILYNIGLIQVSRHDYVAALRAYQRYLEAGGAQIAEARRAAVLKEIEQLRDRIAEVDVRTNIPGAEVFVDDVSVGKTPLSAPLSVNAGRRKISALKTGSPPVAKVIVLAGHDKAKVDLEIFDASRRPDGAKGAPDAPASRKRDVPWVGWGFTAGFTVAAVTTGVLSLMQSASLRDARDTLGVSQETLDKKQATTRGLGIATDVLAGSAIVAFGLSLYFTLSPAPADTPPKQARFQNRARQQADPRAQRAEFRLEIGPARAHVVGTF